MVHLVATDRHAAGVGGRRPRHRHRDERGGLLAGRHADRTGEGAHEHVRRFVPRVGVPRR